MTYLKVFSAHQIFLDYCHVVRTNVPLFTSVNQLGSSANSIQPIVLHVSMFHKVPSSPEFTSFFLQAARSTAIAHFVITVARLSLNMSTPVK